jgi:MFS family permease
MADATPPEPVAKNHPYAIFQNADFARYLSGRLVAVIGQQMMVVAVGWELYDRTGSALALGFVGLSEMVPMLVCTLPAGHLADNYNRKRIIMGASLAVAASSLGLALVSGLKLPVFWTYACLVSIGLAQTFLRPASAAFITGLVPRKALSNAIAWNSGMFQLASVTGPAAGGAIIALTHHAVSVFVFNAVAAMTYFVLLWFVRKQHVVVRPEPLTLQSLATGFKFVFASRRITGMITLDVFAVLLGGAVALLPVYAKDILRVGPGGLGLLQAAIPIGAFCCALVLAHRPPMERAGRTLLWAVAVFGVATIVFGLSHWFWLSFAMLALCGAMDNISIVVRHTSVQLLVPDEKRGRVSAVNNLFVTGASDSLGGFESGAVAHFFGPVFSVVSGGIGTLLAVIGVAWFWPEIRRYGRLDGE